MPKITRWVCLAILALAPSLASAQTLAKLYEPVPPNQRQLLAERAALYVKAFRSRDWWTLFDLVSYDGKRNISKRDFVLSMAENHNPKMALDEYPPRLKHFKPNRTLMSQYGGYDIYGCVWDMKYGDEETGVAILHAVNEKGRWKFTGWQYIDPGADCSVLADANWKPPRPPTWSDPMIEILCAVETCTL